MALVQDPSVVFIILISVVGGVAFLASRPQLRKFFNVVPGVLFIYFIPTALTTCGVLPIESAFYTWTKMYILPMALLLLVMTIDIPAILKLGPKALFVMLFGSLGIVLGGPIVMFFMRDYFPPEAWKGLAALSASWTGGVGNFAAVAESLNAPADVVSPAIIVDTVVGYGWMAIVLFFSSYQKAFNRWNKADDSIVQDVKQRLRSYAAQVTRVPTLADLLIILMIGFGGGYVLFHLGGNLIPEMGKAFSHKMWGVILIILVGVLLSFTKVRRLEGAGASRIGNVALYLLLATIGASGDLRSVMTAPAYLVFGVVWLFIHLIFTLVAARLVRAPLFFVAVGTEANVGGSISCPIVAEAYEEHMAPAGLLLALCGTLIGTYAGIICGLLMQWVYGL